MDRGAWWAIDHRVTKSQLDMTEKEMLSLSFLQGQMECPLLYRLIWVCTLATSCEELTHWKRLWCWEELGPGEEGDDRGWDGWMASLTQWTWVWVNSGNWWRTGRPGVLWFMGSQRVGHNWATELNWNDECVTWRQRFIELIKGEMSLQ